MSKKVTAHPNNPELLIPSGTLTFDADRDGVPYGLSFRKEEIENAQALEAVPYGEGSFAAPTQPMPEHIESLVESAQDKIGGGLLAVDEGHDELTVRWGFGAINKHTDKEIGDFIKDGLREGPPRFANFSDQIRAKVQLDTPIYKKNAVVANLVADLVASQYVFGLPQEKYDPQHTAPGRILSFTSAYGVPDVAVRESFASWINESPEEERVGIVRSITNYIRSIDGNYSGDDKEPFFVSNMEIGQYGRIFFTGSCTYLGSFPDYEIADRIAKGESPRLPSSSRATRIMSDDKYSTYNRDMMFLEHQHETSMAVIGAINKAILEPAKV